MVQLGLLARRNVLREWRTDAHKHGICITNLEMMNAGRSALPFELTDDQTQVLDDILADITGPHPMLRLLQGDVGSGKTAVAFLGMLAAAGSGGKGDQRIVGCLLKYCRIHQSVVHNICQLQ